MAIDYTRCWTTLNELEMVTSKICSAREILDAAIDRIQEHQYDKAETLMYAVDEFLQYYLEEFDEKFKLAWQATVGDLKENDMVETKTKTPYTYKSYDEMVASGMTMTADGIWIPKE